ncbi:MAG TPA: hypothetical protein VMM12_08515, partial [Longimicrobiales bacterium]|nr:hypothetical protein [Longimicrobiales bacterium]
DAVALLEDEGTTSVLWQQVELGRASTTARVRVATTVGVSGDAREAFRLRASELAGEPVLLQLQQLPAAAGDASALQALLRGGGDRRGVGETWPETVDRARATLEQAAWSLPFPEGVEAVGVALLLGGGDDGVVADSAEVAYLAAEPLEPQTAEVLGGFLRRMVGHPALRTSFYRAGPAVLALEPEDTAALGALVAMLRRYPGLRVGVRSAATDTAAASALLNALRSAGVDSVDVERRSEQGPVELRLRRAG